MADSQQKAAIDKFLADNPELEQLRAELAQFNVFRALRIEHAEIRHSNTLAWLLNPSESHGLGDVFLRRMLSNMLLANSAPPAGISAADIEMMDLSDVQVRREWRNTDILILIHGSPNLAVLIENKVGSGEGPGQLVRYRDAIAKEYPSFKLIPVFLTPDGLTSEDDDASDYVCYSYVQALEVLTKIVGQRRSQMPEAVGVFLDQYLVTLRRLTMKDEKLAELCKRIYRQHKEAIDLIVELGGSSEFERVAKEVFEEDGSLEVLASGRNQIRFIPKAWSSIIPENGVAWKGFTRPLSVACLIYKGAETKMRLVAEVSGMDDPQLRLRCVQQLRTAGFKLKDRAMRLEAQFSVFFSRFVPMDDWSSDGELRVALESLLKEAKQHLPMADSVFREVFKTKGSRHTH